MVSINHTAVSNFCYLWIICMTSSTSICAVLHLFFPSSFIHTLEMALGIPSNCQLEQECTIPVRATSYILLLIQCNKADRKQRQRYCSQPSPKPWLGICSRAGLACQDNCKTTTEGKPKPHRVFGILGMYSYPCTPHYSKTHPPKVTREWIWCLGVLRRSPWPAETWDGNAGWAASPLPH